MGFPYCLPGNISEKTYHQDFEDQKRAIQGNAKVLALVWVNAFLPSSGMFIRRFGWSIIARIMFEMLRMIKNTSTTIGRAKLPPLTTVTVRVTLYVKMSGDNNWQHRGSSIEQYKRPEPAAVELTQTADNF